MKPDFTGCATKYNVRCDDPDHRVIAQGAFSNCDGKKVPLVYNHRHGSIKDVLGHAYLHDKNDGVYVEAFLNETDAGKTAREILKHGDIGTLSIFANQLIRKGTTVTKGNIREVSLVLAGANPGATIDAPELIIHGVLTDDEECYYIDNHDLITINDGEEDFVSHSADKSDDTPADAHKGKTNKDIFDSMTEEQKNVVYELVGIAVDAAKNGELDDDDESDDKKTESKEDTMKHSVFDQNSNETMTGSATQEDINEAIKDSKRYGSMRESFLAHGITNLDVVMPEPKAIDKQPIVIQREMGWVDYVMSKVHNTPFANIKSIFADITADEARALGYIKGNLKKEEVFTMLKRTTGPTTIYKKQKMDRDDIIDVEESGFELIPFIKAEMRLMLNEEIARAILISDGRLASSDDKIKEDRIRPISKEEALFTVPVSVSGSTDDDIAKNFIRQAIIARKDYKGSGRPDLFITEELLTKMLLLTDMNGRDMYTDETQLAKKLRVNNIVTVPVMEDAVDAKGNLIYGIIVNLADYNVGMTKGGATAFFEDFDIDYNKQTYLIETRRSGALIKPYSAIILTKQASTSTSTPKV